MCRFISNRYNAHLKSATKPGGKFYISRNLLKKVLQRARMRCRRKATSVRSMRSKIRHYRQQMVLTQTRFMRGPKIAKRYCLVPLHPGAKEKSIDHLAWCAPIVMVVLYFWIDWFFYVNRNNPRAVFRVQTAMHGRQCRQATDASPSCSGGTIGVQAARAKWRAPPHRIAQRSSEAKNFSRHP